MEVNERKERRRLMSSKEAMDKKKEHVSPAYYFACDGNLTLMMWDGIRLRSQFSKVLQVLRRLVTKIGESVRI